MGMRIGGGKTGAIGEMNITPMIDVLLVLLVIFMVMQLGYLTGPELHVPPPDQADDGASPGSLVLEVGPGGALHLNRQPIPADSLAERLHAEFAGRVRRVLFVKGDGAISYGELIAAVDASVEAGVEVVGLAQW